jgi:hypothetical protein
VTDELGERGLAGREEGGGQELALVGELVAMGLGDLLGDPVGAEQAKLAGDLGGEPARVSGRCGACGRVEEAAQVAIAEAGDGELAAGDGLQEGILSSTADRASR